MGWRKPPGTVIVPHPTGWANPYNVAEYGQAGAAARRELAGKALACCCHPTCPATPTCRQPQAPTRKALTPCNGVAMPTAAPPASPAATRPWPVRRCRMHGGSGSSPQAQRAAVRRVLEAQMRGYAAVMMAERQACLDDLAAPGLTPAVYGFERGLRSSPLPPDSA
jgi:hypothetical protein